MSDAPRRARLAVFARALVAACALPACAGGTVVRSFDGQPIEGRFISERAYAYYARAAEAEARGDLSAALSYYAAAADRDDQSAEIWTRLGAVLCSGPKDARGGAREAFARAEAIGPDYAPLFEERARCSLAAGRADEAHAASARAVALDPERDESVILHAEILQKLGQDDEAKRTLVGFVVRDPRSVLGHEALLALATRTGDEALKERVARRLRELSPKRGSAIEAEVPSLRPLAEIDAALLDGDEERAVARATEARLPLADLAARAAALGQSEIAQIEASLVLGADPTSATARLVLAVAADLRGDHAAVTAAMTLSTAPSSIPPSPLARLLFAELLDRSVGIEAARSWLGGFDDAPETAFDPLLARIEKRVRARLA